jgi:hypothetical protein
MLTMTVLGLSPRFSFSGFSGHFAPLRTPPHIIERLTEVFRLAANKPETQQVTRADWTAITNTLDLRLVG